MTFRTVMAGAAALALAACAQRPPLDEQQKTALADSLGQYVAGPFVATFEHPNVDAIMSLYVPGPEVQYAGNGAMVPSRDSLAAMLRAFWGRPGLVGHFTLSAPRVAVIDRDAAVYSTMVTGGVRDSAGVDTPMRFAWTAVFVRVGGQWKVLAEHESAPPPPPPLPGTPARARR